MAGPWGRHHWDIGLEVHGPQGAVENALIESRLRHKLGDAVELVQYGTVLDIRFSNQKYAEVDEALSGYRPPHTELTLIFECHGTDNHVKTIYGGYDHGGVPLILVVELYGSSVCIWVASVLEATMQRVAKQYSSLLAEIIKDDEGRITVAASYLDARQNVVRFTTSVMCPAWSDIAPNYMPIAQEILTEVMNLSVIQGGRLLIWHGEPGTGKSYAIRALMREWSSRYKSIIVADPNAFLEHSLYYYGLLQEYSDQPMLLILEDAATGLLKETRTHRESWIGRLLNMTDGVLTDGRQDVFLLTFNEKFNGLDPAVVRPGRCLAKVEFLKLSPEQANRWLQDQGVESRIDEPITLAELYHRFTGQTKLYQADMPKRLGFNTD